MRTNASRLDPTRFDDLHFDDAPAVVRSDAGPALARAARRAGRAREPRALVPAQRPDRARGGPRRDDARRRRQHLHRLLRRRRHAQRRALQPGRARRRRRPAAAARARARLPDPPAAAAAAQTQGAAAGTSQTQRALPPRRADRLRRGRGGVEAHPRAHRTQRRDRLPGLLPRHGRDQRPLLRAARGDAGAVHALPLLLSLPARPEANIVWARLRQARRDRARGSAQRHADARRRCCSSRSRARAARSSRPPGYLERDPSHQQRARGAADLRRDPERPRPHRRDVRLRARRA